MNDLQKSESPAATGQFAEQSTTGSAIIASVAGASKPLRVSFFAALQADAVTPWDGQWSDLCAYLQNPPEYPTKAACPLLKLAAFGDARTPKGSLRHDANVTAIYGVEGDHDASTMSPEEATLLLQQAGIEALIYTSPSHTPAAPRWRVLAPTSQPYAPAAHRELVGRLNGVLRGAFSSESFALSQAYYYGKVAGAQYAAYRSHGVCIDLVPGLVAVFPGGNARPESFDLGDAPVPEWNGPTDDSDLIRRALASRSAASTFGNKASFADLWERNVERLALAFPDPSRLYDESAADAALASHLLFWTGRDAKRVERLMWQSKLVREKWHRSDYLTRTIRAVIARGGDVLRDKLPTVATPAPADAWPAPTPLPDALPPVQPFKSELLPEALRGWVADIAHRMQCPPDFPAVGAVVAISSLVGARAVVAPKARDDWRVVPNLWGLIVGRPGVMKSPALGEVLKPLHRLEATEREQWQAAHEAWELDCKVAELAAKQNEKQAAAQATKDPAKARALLGPVDTPAEPRARRYVVNDATVEKLGELLTVNPWGVLVYRDELHGLLCSMDRQGQEGARGFYLTGYDGNQGHAVDRIGRGESYIPRVCLAMLGGIQPGKLQSYVREAVAGGTGDDGLLQRFGLAVWPDVNREFAYVDRWPDTPAKQAAWAVSDRLDQLQPASDSDPQEWRFTPEAQALFEEWLIPFETEIRGEELHPALVSHLSKYRKLIPALALIFALVDTPDSGGAIHVNELIRALAWGKYLRSHAERIYVAAVTPETAGAKQLLDKIRAGKLHDVGGVILDTFTPRLVAVKHWAGLGTPEAVRKAADLLADYGWLAREAVPTGAAGGRPAERYLIHPALVTGGRA